MRGDRARRQARYGRQAAHFHERLLRLAEASCTRNNPRASRRIDEEVGSRQRVALRAAYFHRLWTVRPCSLWRHLCAALADERLELMRADSRRLEDFDHA